MTEFTEPRIVELRVENVKRIKAVHIQPDGSAMIEITGKNGQGKSSILDAISYALGGKSVQPQQPIRDGAETASVVVDLGDITVERTWKGDKTELHVRNKEGAKFSGPQAILDRLVGELTFDPLAFVRQAPKEQASTLKDVAGLDFDEIDSLRAGAFEDRTGINRDHKSAKAQLESMPPVPDGTPDEEGSATSLSKEFEDAMNQKHANQDKRDELNKTMETGEAGRLVFEDRIQKSDADVKRLERELETARKTWANNCAMLEEHKKQLVKSIEEAQRVVKTIVDPDIDAITAKINTLDATNAKVRQKKARAEMELRVKDLGDQSVKLTEKIASLDQQKQDMLLAANLPVPDLAFGENGIMLKGLPFDQASSSEQLRVSVAMGLAANPKLKVMLVRDGSLLDMEGRAMLAQLAQDHGAQVWMERATDGEPIGVVIEDGEVKAAAETAVRHGH